VKVCVAGLWHLGTVTAACLAAAGHEVTGWDADRATIARLQKNEPPVFEPGLAELVTRGAADGNLRFTTDAKDALRNAEVVWIAYDTPVDDDDNADIAFVMDSVASLLPDVAPAALVLISSQLPVGSTRAMEQRAGRNDLTFAYSPENLRLGKAIEVFTKPDRIVAGVRNERDRDRIASLLQPFTERIEWMSVESAEMTKHALNAFLATSVAFINEIAAVCEQVGADAREVERGLKSEQRIGPKAYLGPGGAFAGGTLARDIVFLSDVGRRHGVATNLISGVKASNDAHRGWARRRLQELLGDLTGVRIAIWGLTYKPGTDTLRRSSSVELCSWLASQRAEVAAHDPAVKAIDVEGVELCATALEAARDAQALVVMTEWPEYKTVDGDSIAEALSGRRLVLDANRFLAVQLAAHPRITYATVGTSLQ
jgi:UDPglucose 6-dehydrogenase